MHDSVYISYLCLATVAYIILFTAHVWVRSDAIKKVLKSALEASIIFAYAILSIACGLAVGVNIL